MTGLRGALAFLTPLAGPAAPDPRAAAWFGPVGAAIGLAVGLVWWGASEVWTPLVAAALAVVADLALTGMLHLDGLADSADGLLPHLERDRRLEVMAAPDLGAFGLAAGGSALLLRFACFASIDPAPLVVAGVWAASRALAAGVLATQPYARARGLATAFQGGAPLPAVVALVGAAVLAGWAVVGVLAGLAVVALARRKLGGYTGDVLGASIVLAETAGLLVAAA